jgi:CheY-like chemotaxis protein
MARTNARRKTRTAKEFTITVRRPCGLLPPQGCIAETHVLIKTIKQARLLLDFRIMKRSCSPLNTRRGEADGAPVPETDVGPDAERAAVLKDGPVLLVEFDSCFRESIRDHLRESRYTVVEFQDSRDALKEVLAGDFALILYNPATPGLPTDMFCRGIYRIDPALCARIVFLISDNNDAGTGAFIKKVHGFVLRKPFDVKSLADRIAASKVLGTLHGAFETASADPGLSGICLPEDDFEEDGKSHSHITWFGRTLREARAETPKEAPAEAQRAPAIARPRAPAERTLAPGPLRGRVPVFETKTRLHWVWRGLVCTGLAALYIVLLAWTGSYDAHDWAAAQAQRTPILHRRDKITTGGESGSDAPPAARAAGNHAVPLRPPTVHDIVAAANEEIELAEVRVLPKAEAPDVFEVSIRGTAGGLRPKVVVERFRQVVVAGLKRHENRSRASARIEQFEEVPGALPEQKRSRFFIIATVSPSKSPMATGRQAAGLVKQGSD